MSLDWQVPAFWSDRDEELLEVGLWFSAASCGVLHHPTVTSGIRAGNLFFRAETDEEVVAELEGMREWCPSLVWKSPERLQRRDWLATWRELAQPFPLGKGLWIDPRELDEGACDVAPEGRVRLHLPARQAFGIGSHTSTRLAAEWLEELDCSGLRVLDLGTGTGILGWIAKLRGAEEVLGCDLCPAAACYAGWIVRREQLEGFRIYCGSLRSLGIAANSSFDLAIANVVPRELEPDLLALRCCLKPAGRLLLSGCLAEEAEAWCHTLLRCGFSRVCERRAEGEWMAMMLEV